MKTKSELADQRDFLASTGTAFSAMAAARAEASDSTFCVDSQSHLFAPEMISFMQKRRTSPYVYHKEDDLYVVVGEWHRRLRPNHMDAKAKLADMDAAGINMTALSINDPGPERFGKDGPEVARMANDFLAAVAREHPTRFFGLAVLPLQDMEAALVELDRCVGKLGMKGILLYSNLDGRFPDLPEFRPLFRRAEELDIPILLHPAYPITNEATKGYEMTAGLGLMFDTTIALARIILAGILDEHPKLKLVCPHVGGTLPYLIGRIDHQTQVLKRGAEKITKLPSQYLRQIYLDTVSPLPSAIRYGYDFVGADRLLYASDHPWVDPKLILGHIRSLNLPPKDEKKIFGGNAKQLFRL